MTTNRRAGESTSGAQQRVSAAEGAEAGEELGALILRRARLAWELGACSDSRFREQLSADLATVRGLIQMHLRAAADSGADSANGR